MFPDDMLTTTTLPFPTRCRACQRWYVAFQTRCKSWHRSVFPNQNQIDHNAFGDNVPESWVVRVPTKIRQFALEFPHTMNTLQCRTQPPARFEELVRGIGIDVEALETHGGMGRIYGLRDATKILKIGDVRTGWCKFEHQNYQRLEAMRLPCPHVYHAEIRTVDGVPYFVAVLERLEFTLTAFIRAIGRRGGDPKIVVNIVLQLLRALRHHGLVYADLSPDNIMFRALQNDQYEIAFIDPQFLVNLTDFSTIGATKARAFDTIYAALKIQAIGLLDPDVRKFTNAITKGILGHVPPEKRTRYWLMNEAPVGLFIAYAALRRNANDSPN